MNNTRPESPPPPTPIPIPNANAAAKCQNKVPNANGILGSPDLNLDF